MKMVLATVLALAASPVFAQQTGVSNPPDANVEDMGSQPATAVATDSMQPAPAPPAAAPSASTYTAPVATASSTAPVQCVAPSAYAATAPSAPDSTPVLRTRVLDPETEADSGVVTTVATDNRALLSGTQLHARLLQAVGTTVSTEGTPFVAELTSDVVHEGQVIFPKGARVDGRITEVRAGHRIRGTALLHLEVTDIVMPDGTRVPVRASVIDTDQWDATRVDDEGNIIHRAHPAKTLVEASAMTGGAAAVGGIAGGAPGAVIGAVFGAGAGTVLWLNQDRQEHLPEGTVLTLMLNEPYQLGTQSSPSTVSQVQQPTPVAHAPVPQEPTAFVPTN